MREITGKELERALLKTQGRTWDGACRPKLSVSDLKQDHSYGKSLGADTATNLLLKSFENDAKRAIFGEIDVSKM